MSGREPAGRRRAYVTTALTLIALVAIVVLVDSLPLMEAARGQLWGLNSLHYAEFDQKLPARRSMELHIGVGPRRLQPEQPAPALHPEGGVFSQPVVVEVRAADPQSALHCTFDGRIPTARDARRSEPLEIRKTTILRCRAFRSGFQASSTTTATYLVNAPGALPVLALTIDPTNLANKYTGIYSRFRERGPEWERDAHVEYLPRSSAAAALKIPGRARIHGFYSRSNPKKSFRFYYAGMPADAHDPDNLLTWTSAQAERVVIFGAREMKVSRDELFQKLYSDAGGLAPANMPVFLYLNAEPWGIYYVRERLDDEFLQRRIELGEYDLLDAQPGKPRVLAGDREHWDRTIRFFASNDLTDPDAFAAAARRIDVENFTTYWLFNIYAANRDWPHHNMNMFRPREAGDGRWRWISWDADATFDFLGKGLTHDTLAWATRSQLRHDLRLNHEAGLRDNEGMLASTLIARKLLENPTYRDLFARRMAQLLESELHPERIMSAVDAMHGAIANDLALDWKRWSLDSSEEALAAAYREDLGRVKNFVVERPKQLSRFFSSLESGTPELGRTRGRMTESLAHARRAGDHYRSED